MEDIVEFQEGRSTNYDFQVGKEENMIEYEVSRT
jgi:hypothetical protein